MRVLVCGGRDYTNSRHVTKVLNALQPSAVIHGDARGADRLAGIWAFERRVVEVAYPANWNKHGKAAGPIRNQKMLDDAKPDLVVAFPGGKGTEDLKRRARRAKIPIVESTPHPYSLRFLRCLYKASGPTTLDTLPE